MSRSSATILLLAAPLACGEPVTSTFVTAAEVPVAASSTLAAADCPKQSGSKSGKVWKQCGTGAKEGPCDKFDPIKSNRCLAEKDRSVTVDYRFFGEVDCRTSSRGGKKITKIVVHNGDSAEKNNENWHCRKGASHYTIDRDGKIYQHAGEELATWHASSTPVNDVAIGIELQIRRKYGESCNSMHESDAAKIAKEQGIAAEDVIAQLCAPTLAQYVSLDRLVKDISSRHPIADVLGHCEVKGTDHGDPRVFDWTQLGQPQRAEVNVCSWYDARAVVSDVIGVEKIDANRSRVTLRGGKTRGVEVGDHGWLTDASEREPLGRWFEVEKVTDKATVAIVGMSEAEVTKLGIGVVVAHPGKTPPALPAALKGSKPALGSCETEYGYHKDGKIASFIVGLDGMVTALVLKDAGWADGVCDDATGMIYLGDASDAYVTDGGGTKIRFRMNSVDKHAASAKVIAGKLDPKLIASNKRVVVRKAK